MKYAFKNTGHPAQVSHGVDANDAAAALEEIRKKYDGQLRPEDVINEARKKSHILHAFFEWDDSAAAHLYRKHQARHLIKNIQVVENETLTPAFINVSIYSEGEENQRYYQSVKAATQDEYASALNLAQRRLREAVRSLEILKSKAPRGEKGKISKAIKQIESAGNIL